MIGKRARGIRWEILSANKEFLFENLHKGAVIIFYPSTIHSDQYGHVNYHVARETLPPNPQLTLDDGVDGEIPGNGEKPEIWPKSRKSRKMQKTGVSLSELSRPDFPEIWGSGTEIWPIFPKFSPPWKVKKNRIFGKSCAHPYL